MLYIKKTKLSFIVFTGILLVTQSAFSTFRIVSKLTTSPSPTGILGQSKTFWIKVVRGDGSAGRCQAPSVIYLTLSTNQSSDIVWDSDRNCAIQGIFVNYEQPQNILSQFDPVTASCSIPDSAYYRKAKLVNNPTNVSGSEIRTVELVNDYLDNITATVK